MSVADCSLQKNDGQGDPYRAVPLSTKNIISMITFLSFFSIVYLIYAQHHKVLFYIMTSVIVVWIAFVYCSGILAVLYMVRYDYPVAENTKKKTRKAIHIDESMI